MALIETRDLWKTYVMGSEEIHALRGVSMEIDREGVVLREPSGREVYVAIRTRK